MQCFGGSPRKKDEKQSKENLRQEEPLVITDQPRGQPIGSVRSSTNRNSNRRKSQDVKLCSCFGTNQQTRRPEVERFEEENENEANTSSVENGEMTDMQQHSSAQSDKKLSPRNSEPTRTLLSERTEAQNASTSFVPNQRSKGQPSQNGVGLSTNSVNDDSVPQFENLMPKETAKHDEDTSKVTSASDDGQPLTPSNDTTGGHLKDTTKQGNVAMMQHFSESAQVIENIEKIMEDGDISVRQQQEHPKGTSLKNIRTTGLQSLQALPQEHPRTSKEVQNDVMKMALRQTNQPTIERSDETLPRTEDDPRAKTFVPTPVVPSTANNTIQDDKTTTTFQDFETGDHLEVKEGRKIQHIDKKQQEQNVKNTVHYSKEESKASMKCDSSSTMGQHLGSVHINKTQDTEDPGSGKSERNDKASTVQVNTKSVSFLEATKVRDESCSKVQNGYETTTAGPSILRTAPRTEISSTNNAIPANVPLATSSVMNRTNYKSNQNGVENTAVRQLQEQSTHNAAVLAKTSPERYSDPPDKDGKHKEDKIEDAVQPVVEELECAKNQDNSRKVQHPGLKQDLKETNDSKVHSSSQKNGEDVNKRNEIDNQITALNLPTSTEPVLVLSKVEQLPVIKKTQHISKKITVGQEKNTADEQSNQVSSTDKLYFENQFLPKSPQSRSMDKDPGQFSIAASSESPSVITDSESKPLLASLQNQTVDNDRVKRIASGSPQVVASMGKEFGNQSLTTSSQHLSVGKILEREHLPISSQIISMDKDPGQSPLQENSEILSVTLPASLQNQTVDKDPGKRSAPGSLKVASSMVTEDKKQLQPASSPNPSVEKSLEKDGLPALPQIPSWDKDPGQLSLGASSESPSVITDSENKPHPTVDKDSVKKTAPGSLQVVSSVDKDFGKQLLSTSSQHPLPEKNLEKEYLPPLSRVSSLVKDPGQVSLGASSESPSVITDSKNKHFPAFLQNQTVDKDPGNRIVTGSPQLVSSPGKNSEKEHLQVLPQIPSLDNNAGQWSPSRSPQIASSMGNGFEKQLLSGSSEHPSRNTDFDKEHLVSSQLPSMDKDSAQSPLGASSEIPAGIKNSDNRPLLASLQNPTVDKKPGQWSPSGSPQTAIPMGKGFEKQLLSASSQNSSRNTDIDKENLPESSQLPSMDKDPVQSSFQVSSEISSEITEYDNKPSPASSKSSSVGKGPEKDPLSPSSQNLTVDKDPKKQPLPGFQQIPSMQKESGQQSPSTMSQIPSVIMEPERQPRPLSSQLPLKDADHEQQSLQQSSLISTIDTASQQQLLQSLSQTRSMITDSGEQSFLTLLKTTLMITNPESQSISASSQIPRAIKELGRQSPSKRPSEIKDPERTSVAALSRIPVSVKDRGKQPLLASSQTPSVNQSSGRQSPQRSSNIPVVVATHHPVRQPLTANSQTPPINQRNLDDHHQYSPNHPHLEERDPAASGPVTKTTKIPKQTAKCNRSPENIPIHKFSTKVLPHTNEINASRVQEKGQEIAETPPTQTKTSPEQKDHTVLSKTTTHSIRSFQYTTKIPATSSSMRTTDTVEIREDDPQKTAIPLRTTPNEHAIGANDNTGVVNLAKSSTSTGKRALETLTVDDVKKLTVRLLKEMLLQHGVQVQDGEEKLYLVEQVMKLCQPLSHSSLNSEQSSGDLTSSNITLRKRKLEPLVKSDDRSPQACKKSLTYRDEDVDGSLQEVVYNQAQEDKQVSIGHHQKRNVAMMDNQNPHETTHEKIMEGTDLQKINSLEDIPSAEIIQRLGVRQIKSILTKHWVNFEVLQEKSELVAKLRQLWNEKKQEKEMEVSNENCCRICMSNAIDCAFLDCGHMIACTDCGHQIKECPVCCQYIVKAVHLFQATTNADQGNLCIICQTWPIDSMFVDCGHSLTCNDCGYQTRQCPECHMYTNRIARIYRC